jgi:DNA-binding NarL/FixJ family response regulator
VIRLLIADDHPVVREGLRRVVESASFVVVAEATNGDDLLARAAEVQADVVLLDITMPGPGFVEVIQRLRLLRPNLRVLVLSVQPEDQFGLRVLQAGAAGYLSKNQSPEQLVAAIRRVVGGGRYVSPAPRGTIVGRTSSCRRASIRYCV